MATKLLDGVTADGKGSIISAGELTQHHDGTIPIKVKSANFGGGTVTIYASEQNTEASMAPVDGGEFTASLVKNLAIARTWYVQAGLSGATTPSAVDCVAGGD